MDTDNKTQGDNISNSDKTTMHNAGVDVAADVDEFIDIDSTKPLKEDSDLKDLGLTFVEEANKEDLSLLSEKMREAEKQKIAAVEKKEDTQEKTKDKTAQISHSDSLEPGQSADDLEKEFKKTVGTSSVSSLPGAGSLGDKISSLQSMLTKIKEKLGFKKTEVKEELENLKKVKEDISKDIENIKELEESEQKIESELKKIEKIREEISGIEKEVEEELKA